MSEPVYKILRKSEWKAFQDEGVFLGSEADVRDGFIHLSKADQLDRVIKKYFNNIVPLYIVKFKEKAFLKKLKWEKASNGDLYPHYYGFLSIQDVNGFEEKNSVN